MSVYIVLPIAVHSVCGVCLILTNADQVIRLQEVKTGGKEAARLGGKSISLDGTSFSKNRFYSLLGAATVSTAVSFLVLLADTFIVGHFVGAIGVSAINIVAPVLSVSAFVSQIFGTGTAYVYSRLIGEFKRDEANSVFGQGVVTVAAVTVLQLLIFFLLWKPYLDYMGLSGAVRIEAENYWRFEQYVLLLYPANYLLSDTVYMDGDKLVSNVANIALISCNVILSIVFCSLMGTAGASLGGMIGTLLCTLILCVHFLRKSNTIYARISFRWAVLKETVSLSITDATPYLCWGALDFCLNKMVISRYTDAYVPVLTMVINILETTLLFDGIGEAMAPLAELYMGENNYVGEKELAKYGLRIAVVEGVLALELLFIFAPVVPSLYGVASADIVPASVAAVRILALSLPLSAILFFFTSQFRIVRKTTLSVIITFAAQFLLVLLFAVLLIDRAGLKGIWYAFILGYTAAILLSGIAIFCINKKSQFPWLCPEDREHYLNCSFILSRENVMTACQKFTEFMQEHNVPKPTQLRANLILEETGTLAFHDNKLRESIAEYTVGIQPDGVYIVTRDTGDISDITQTDGNLDDVQAYVVGKLMQETSDKQYLISASFNRCYYRIPYPADQITEHGE